MRYRWVTLQNHRRIKKLAKDVQTRAVINHKVKPVVFFNASARLTDISLNAAFSLLVSWSLRLAAIPVVNFVCQSGMSHCVQGTNREDYTTPPPCRKCIHQSQLLYRGSKTTWFKFTPQQSMVQALQDKKIHDLSDLQVSLDSGSSGRTETQPDHTSQLVIPLGSLVQPSIRWALRLHELPDDEPTRYLYRQYLLSAFNLAQKFDQLISEIDPQAVVVFNGMMYPEAVVCWLARKRGLRVITHEVGFQPYSAFFSHGEATAYPIDIPDNFKFNPGQEQMLDQYLEKRFKGKFTMAGIKFWPEMEGLSDTFLQHSAQFRQIVPIFTNVIYDTSQVHANTIFPHMFAWLDFLEKIFRAHPDTLFVIRAHPDEMRPGTRKQSRQSVRQWVKEKNLEKSPNILFIDSQDYVSSYELIQKAKFLMVYNSSIGLEATLMGIPVLCGGKARYTQYPTVYLPNTIDEFKQLAEDFLTTEMIKLPNQFQENARRFLYYQLYRASLPFEQYLQFGMRPGFVQLRDFSWQQLNPHNSNTLKTIYNGIVDGKSFLLDKTNEYITD